MCTPPPFGISFSGQLYLILCLRAVAGKSRVRLVSPWEALSPLLQEEWERIPAQCNVLEGMEEEDPQNDGKESANGSHHTINGHVQPFFKEDGRAGHDGGGEEHVVNGSNHRGVKDVEGLVQVVDLNADTDYQADD